MPNDIPWWRRPGVHLRHDAHRWIRHDAARFVRPGFDPADVFPTLARKAQGVQAPTFDDELAADIAAARRVNHAMQDALNEVRAELARWRALDEKYSPTQPRIPAGNPRGGQWTDGSGGQNAGQAIGQDAGQRDLASLTQPMGNVDIGDVTGSSELGDLFNIAPADTRVDGVQLAGDLPEGLGGDAPEIPQEKPGTSSQRTGYLRAALNWIARNAVAGEIYAGMMNNVEWLKDYHDLVQAARDEPKTFEELQQGVGQRKPGYDDHHIVEQTAAERAGFTRSQIDDPENVVKIPRIAHYQITGWYMAGNVDFDGLSPREYLDDKSWEERRRVGLSALKIFKVLKP
jgi:hypothetical protein